MIAVGSSQICAYMFHHIMYIVIKALKTTIKGVEAESLWLQSFNYSKPIFKDILQTIDVRIKCS